VKENETVINLLIASSFRNIALQTMRLYLPLYYASAFPDDITKFGEFNALFLCVLGFSASLGGGIISDRLSQGNPKENPWSKLIVTSCVSTLPIWAYMFLRQDSFELSMGTLALQYLTAECWLPPFYQILRSSVSPE
jgi:nitrate/nitrite transporter NarK